MSCDQCALGDRLVECPRCGASVDRSCVLPCAQCRERTCHTCSGRSSAISSIFWSRPWCSVECRDALDVVESFGPLCFSCEGTGFRRGVAARSVRCAVCNGTGRT